MDALLTSGSVAGGRITRDTSEEPEEKEEEQEDPFSTKIKFKRRIVMSDNEDDD